MNLAARLICDTLAYLHTLYTGNSMYTSTFIFFKFSEASLVPDVVILEGLVWPERKEDHGLCSQASMSQIQGNLHIYHKNEIGFLGEWS